MLYYFSLIGLVLAILYFIYRWLFTVRETKRGKFEDIKHFFDKFIANWPPDGIFDILTDEFDKKHCLIEKRYSGESGQSHYTFIVEETSHESGYFKNFVDILNNKNIKYEILDGSGMMSTRRAIVPASNSKEKIKEFFLLIPDGFDADEDQKFIGKAWAVREFVKRA